MSFGEVIPSQWYFGVYKLETDGTDSSGNTNTLPGLNTPNFAVARFGAGGMDGGTSGINRGLRHTTLNISGGSSMTCIQVGMWFKLNTTTITTNSVFFMIQAVGGGSHNYETFALGTTSGGNLTIQLVLTTTTTAITASVTVPADLNWHYIIFTVDLISPTGLHLLTVTYDGTTNQGTANRTVSSGGGNRIGIGNHTTSSTLQMWGMFDQVTISINTHRLDFFQLQNRYAQARGMFAI